MLIIKTRKLPATQSDSERVRATDGSTVLDIPFPYGESDPYAHAARMFARVMGYSPAALEWLGGKTYGATVDVMIVDEVAYVIAEHAGVDAATARATAERLI